MVHLTTLSRLLYKIVLSRVWAMVELSAEGTVMKIRTGSLGYSGPQWHWNGPVKSKILRAYTLNRTGPCAASGIDSSALEVRSTLWSESTSHASILAYQMFP